MALTSIEWTGTPLARELVIPHDIRVDNKVWLAAGTYPVGHVVPGFTFNPWIGCMKVSEECDDCYAEELVTGRMGYNPTSNDPRRRLVLWGPPSTTARFRTSRDNWQKPHLWNRLAKLYGVRFKVFCASLADLFEDHPSLPPWREDFFKLVEQCDAIDWLFLTKRADLVMGMVPAAWRERWPRHVWMGATTGNDRRARERIPHLRKVPAPVRFLSVEPLVVPRPDERPLDLTGMLDGIAWAIFGGKSGPRWKPMPHDLLERNVAACDAADVWVFVKQDAGPQPGRRGALSDALWARKEFPLGAIP